MRMKNFFAGIALACLSVFANPAFADSGPWVETKTPLLASATFTGNAHYLAGIGAGTSGASFFGASFTADQNGTCYIDVSDNGSTWVVASTLALTAGNTNDLTVRVRSAYYRVRYVNGGTNQGAFTVYSSETQN